MVRWTISRRPSPPAASSHTLPPMLAPPPPQSRRRRRRRRPRCRPATASSRKSSRCHGLSPVGLLRRRCLLRRPVVARRLRLLPRLRRAAGHERLGGGRGRRRRRRWRRRRRRQGRGGAKGGRGRGCRQVRQAKEFANRKKVYPAGMGPFPSSTHGRFPCVKVTLHHGTTHPTHQPHFLLLPLYTAALE